MHQILNGLEIDDVEHYIYDKDLIFEEIMSKVKSNQEWMNKLEQENLKLRRELRKLKGDDSDEGEPTIEEVD